jgi:hypothetical protein
MTISVEPGTPWNLEGEFGLVPNINAVPASLIDRPPRTSVSVPTFTTEQLFTCQTPGEYTIYYDVNMGYQQLTEWDNVAPIADTEFSVDALEWIPYGSGTGTCVAGPSTTSGTTTTTSAVGGAAQVFVTGEDPEGDGKNGESETVTPEEDVPGADIKSVRHERGPSGEICFIIDVYGDGKKTATDAEEHVGNYLIDVEVPGPDGWGTRVEFRNGVPEAGSVRLGPLAPGREILEGAEVSVEWIDSDTMKVTVAGTGTDLGVDTFFVDINVFWAGGSFYDHAEGIGES